VSVWLAVGVIIGFIFGRLRRYTLAAWRIEDAAAETERTEGDGT